MDKINKTQLYASHKRLTSALRTRKLKVKEWEDILHKWKPIKSRGWYINII